MEHSIETPSATPAAAANGASTPAIDLTGRALGDYQVLRRLGQGGMGQVYLAEQVSLKRKVALKILRADLAANPTSLQRFRAEAEAVARATHANIVQVYAIGECEGLYFMALEYVEGRNLSEYLAKKGTTDVLLALSIMRQVAAALQRASELGIIHRDIKPDNILLTRNREVKVADFGLSRCLAGDQQPLKLTQSGITMGTPLYMSPEQVEGRPVDPRTDIYSFGVTCYHMLAGNPPYRGETAFEVALKHVNAQPEPLSSIRPDLPAELCAVIHKMMAKDPAARYQTGRDLLLDVTRLRDGLSGVTGNWQTQQVPAEVLPQPVSVPSTLILPTARRRWPPWAVAVSLLVAAAGGAGLGWCHRQGWFPFSREAEQAAPATPGADDVSAVKAMFSLEEREKFLLAAVDQYAKPGSDPNRLRLGLGHCLELGLFYLDQDRFDDAEQFFVKLESTQQVKAYRELGQLGHAIVLAFPRQRQEESGKTVFDYHMAESNKRFQEFFGDVLPKADRLFVELLRENIRLRQMITKALQHNQMNATPQDKFPPELTMYLKPWTLTPPKGRGDRPPPGKGS